MIFFFWVYIVKGERAELANGKKGWFVVQFGTLAWSFNSYSIFGLATVIANSGNLYGQLKLLVAVI